MDWSNRKVLVTGAGGFIGSHLAEALVDRGAEVRAFVHYNALGRRGWLDYSPVKKEIEVVAGDISDRDSVRKAVKGVEAIFHLAALIGIPFSYQAPASYVQTNIVGTLNVLQSALDEGVDRVVHTSTSEVYGTAQYVPIDEGHPLQGQSPYAATKIGADKLAESFHRSFGLPVATVRPFNAYGPRQSTRAVIPTIITQALTQEKIMLGNLTATRDMNYVQDTARGFILVAESPAAVGEVINIGTGREITIGDLAKAIFTIVGKELDIFVDNQRLRPEASEVNRLCADISKAKQLFDWEPAFTLEGGLRETVKWFGKNLGLFRTGDYNV